LLTEGNEEILPVTSNELLIRDASRLTRADFSLKKIMDKKELLRKYRYLLQTPEFKRLMLRVSSTQLATLSSLLRCRTGSTSSGLLNTAALRSQ